MNCYQCAGFIYNREPFCTGYLYGVLFNLHTGCIDSFINGGIMFQPNQRVAFTFNVQGRAYSALHGKAMPYAKPMSGEGIFLRMRLSPTGDRAILKVKDPCGFREMSIPIDKVKALEASK